MFVDEGIRLLVHRFMALLKVGPLMSAIQTQITVTGAIQPVVLPADMRNITVGFLCLLRVIHVRSLALLFEDMRFILLGGGDNSVDTAPRARFCEALTMMMVRVFTPEKTVRPEELVPVYNAYEREIIGGLTFSTIELENIRQFAPTALPYLERWY
ncbi:hypothetical protein QKR09_gp1 [Fiwi virus]|uniref:Uncharacterized protein n=1 Tax=Fiwi virus TaxID=2675848 RepID=A0AAE6U983_9MONO|nr:hypothetical protein QKR09_gp1 [Fiwi virus]QGM12354.2 hypothetical protein [Fiwi virus]